MPMRPREMRVGVIGPGGRFGMEGFTEARCIYSYFQSGSVGCLMSQSGRRLRTTGILEKLYSGGGELVVHSKVHASQGSSPAGRPLQRDRPMLNTNIRRADA